MSRRFFTFLFFLLLQYVKSNAGTGFIYLADTTKLFYASNNEVYTPDQKELLYFQKGNIFFKGNGDNRENIFLLVSSLSLNSDRTELIYEKDNQRPSISFSNNKFYAGNSESEDSKQHNELLHIQRYKKWLSFYSSGNDSLLAYYAVDSFPSSTAIIVAYTLIKRFELEKKKDIQQRSLPFVENSYASIKPIWGNQTANEWIWDGKILRPRWNVDPRLAWTFDGETVKPQYGTNIYAQYSWDGENFKPVWRSNKAEEWSWDGRIMKPTWDTDWANQYTIEDGAVKPWSNVHPEKEWSVNGNIPIPLIILIISGIGRSY